MRRGNATTSQMRGRQCNNQPDKRPKSGGTGGDGANEERPHNMMRDDGAGQRHNNQPWVGEAMEGGGRRVKS
jgi:hypothetical protein